MKRALIVTLQMALMLTFLGDDCGGSLVEDGSFRLWESETKLAAWEVTEGSIRKAPTWDEADPGVEFIDTPTALEQTITSSSSCLKITLMGRVDPDARLTVSNGEGRSFAVPTLDWASHTAYLSVVSSWNDDAGTRRGGTLRLRKAGSGAVILAKIDARSGNGCGPSTYGDEPSHEWQ